MRCSPPSQLTECSLQRHILILSNHLKAACAESATLFYAVKPRLRRGGSCEFSIELSLQKWPVSMRERVRRILQTFVGRSDRLASGTPVPPLRMMGGSFVEARIWQDGFPQQHACPGHFKAQRRLVSSAADIWIGTIAVARGAAARENGRTIRKSERSHAVMAAVRTPGQ